MIINGIVLNVKIINKLIRRWKYIRLHIFSLFILKGLDISNYIIHKDELPLVYDLFAISNHFGGLGGGHYMAYAMNPINQNWYEFNDSHVSSISEDNLVTNAAYVLFYRRRDLGNYINLNDLYNKKFEDYEKREEQMDIDNSK